MRFLGACGAVGKKNDLVGSDGTNGMYINDYQGTGSPGRSPFFSPVRNSEVRHLF